MIGDALVKEEGIGGFVDSSSQTMVMMRRWGSTSKNNITIQHQRTCDVCFYVKEDENSYPWKQLYQTIETLLPKASIGE